MLWMLPLIVVAAVVAVVAASRGDDAPAPRGSAEPPAAERQAGLGEHLAALQRIADDNGGTRAAGTPGDEATAAYIEARLRAAGTG